MAETALSEHHLSHRSRGNSMAKTPKQTLLYFPKKLIPLGTFPRAQGGKQKSLALEKLAGSVSTGHRGKSE